MGNSSSSNESSGGNWFKRFKNRNKIRIVLIAGLNNAGKSTILCNMNPKILNLARDMEVPQLSTSPTSGVALVEFSKDARNWRIWDMSGQGRYREMWTYYCGHVQAIIFVVDVTDGDRIACARDELQTLLDQPRVHAKRLPVLMFANKADLTSGGDSEETANPDGGSSSKSKSLTIDNVRMAFNVDSLNASQRIKVFSSSGLTGMGVSEGFQWLDEAMAVDN